MAEITAAAIKALREKTGAGMMECKKALVEADGKPRSRRISFARSSLPPASISAFLHSIIPAPVFSRSALTAAALMSAMITYFLLITMFIHENAQPGGGSAAEAALAA